MAYEKKVLVLKRTECDAQPINKPLCGIARIEIENGVAEFHLSLINLPKDIVGSYHALIIDGEKERFYFPLGFRPSSFATVMNFAPNYKNGLAVGIYSVKDDIPVTVAFARADGFNFTLSDFKKIVAEKCITDRKKDKKECDKPAPLPNGNPCPKTPNEPSPVKPPYPPAPNPDPSVTPPDEFNKQRFISGYDDEAVATVNYYSLEEEIQDKINAVKEKERGYLPFENELPTIRNQEKTLESNDCFDGSKDETNACERFSGKKERYLDTVREELTEVFSKHPVEQELSRTFPDSRWAKIYYSKEKFYVVGVIKENGTEKYICYGVPATYSPEPPKELKGCSSFIPLSVFNMKGDGYWMMFQDAETGACIHIETV